MRYVEMSGICRRRLTKSAIALMLILVLSAMSCRTQKQTATMQSNTEILQTVSKNIDFSAQKSTAEARHVSEHIVERRMSKPDSLGNQYVETETVTDRITDSNSQTDTETTAETTDTLTIKAHSSEDVKMR